MRLTFPNGEHPDADLEGRPLTLGSGEGNAVRLDTPGIAVRHAVIAADLGGVWLTLQPDAAPAHVNARPVHRLALLRAGDVVTLEGVRILLRAPVADAPGALLDAPLPDGDVRIAALRVVLRGMAGPHFGRAFALDVPRLVGRSPTADVRILDPAVAERHAQLELRGGRVLLRALSAEGCQVNGQAVHGACLLESGDQLVVEQHRFVLDAPGLVPAEEAADTDVLAVFHDIAAEPVPEAVATRASGGGMAWWLLLAAAALGAAIALLLVYAPRLAA